MGVWVEKSGMCWDIVWVDYIRSWILDCCGRDIMWIDRKMKR